MRVLTLVALMVVALTGCAGTSWQEYAAKNDCVATGNSDIKKETTMTNMAAGAGNSLGYSGGPATVAIPRVSVRRVYQYACKGGPIWSYNAPARATDMVATQRQ